MTFRIDPGELEASGLALADARALAEGAEALVREHGPAVAWRELTRPRPGSPGSALAARLTRAVPFAVHRHLYHALADARGAGAGPLAAWWPTPAERMRANVAALARDRGLAGYAALHAWSVDDRAAFWGAMLERLGIRFRTPPARVADDLDARHPRWLPGARLNLAESCFGAEPDAVAVIARDERAPDALALLTYAELDRLSNRVAGALAALGLEPGDAVGVCLPLTPAAVALFIGLLKAGVVGIGIADSFAPGEIATRLRLGGAKAAFAEAALLRGGKALPLYPKLVAAGAPRTVVLRGGPGAEGAAAPLRDGDLDWEAFLAAGSERFEPVLRDPDDRTTILFSSGTTGEPKTIPWTCTTPLKCAVDAHLHQDVQPGDVLAWPTSLGWMMGPWLIYAALLNRATIALYDGLPSGAAFCRFVEESEVTMLGVVPSLVAAWRRGRATDGVDWSRIRCFSSTGECSNQDDMLWLMAQAGYRPIIEYMGGTEIGGGYLTGTLVQPAAPAAFTTPACGLDIAILDERGAESASGELFLRGPSIGLSQALLHRDHDEVYFAGAPAGPRGEDLRRHGDHVARLPGGFLRAHGRVDDTMKLGGIKVSSAEIERAVTGVLGVRETAAIAVPPAGGGPSELVVYAVAPPAGAGAAGGTNSAGGGAPAPDAAALRDGFQRALRERLNPLFKVAEVRIVAELPRTASNKVMRRELRARYLAERG